MVTTDSKLFQQQDILGAGRGLVATSSILPDTPLLCSPKPAAHVIFRQYRKEVCAQCFHYDRGRTLSVRDNTTAKVFCSDECYSRWLEENGDTGLDAWQSLESYIGARRKHVACLTDEAFLGPKPDERLVKTTWHRADSVLQAKLRIRSGLKSEHEALANGDRKAPQNPFTQTVDPDILGFLLSTILQHHQTHDSGCQGVTMLAMDSAPYKSTAELEAHCASFLQLSSILPRELMSSCTSHVCYMFASAASHNAFGIRSGSEDGEEYMGYAVYPEASYFNHSCAPNIAKRRVGREWRFQAARDIAINEQLCISYLGGDEKDMNVTERRDRLNQVWGFTCACSRCLQESGQV